MEVRNIQTCPAVAVTTFLKKFRTPAIIDPTIPGSAAAALPTSRPKSLASDFSLLFTHSPTLLGFFGVKEPPAAPPPVNEVMMVEMTSPSDVNTTVIVKPCSRKMSFSFSQRLMSSSRLFSAVWRMRENWEASSLRFCDTISSLALFSSFKSAMIFLTLSSCTCRSGESLISASFFVLVQYVRQSLSVLKRYFPVLL